MSKGKRKEAKSLKVEIMESAKPRMPRSSTLSDREETLISAYVEKVVGHMLRDHGDREREDFEIDKEGFQDQMDAFFSTQANIAENPALKKIALRKARKLADEWQGFIRRSEMLKQLQLSAQEFVNSLR